MSTQVLAAGSVGSRREEGLRVRNEWQKAGLVGHGSNVSMSHAGQNHQRVPTGKPGGQGHMCASVSFEHVLY